MTELAKGKVEVFYSFDDYFFNICLLSTMTQYKHEEEAHNFMSVTEAGFPDGSGGTEVC